MRVKLGKRKFGFLSKAKIIRRLKRQFERSILWHQNEFIKFVKPYKFNRIRKLGEKK